MSQPPINSSIDWKTYTGGSLVSLQTHNLYLHAAGPPRQPGEPAILIEAGLGESSINWSAISRLLSSFMRVYSYDRSGLGFSDVSPIPHSAENAALELKKLLDVAGIKGPFIVIAHSYGGILAREFLGLVGSGGEGVVGMIFVDANTENSYKVRPKDLHTTFDPLMEGLDWDTIRGLEKKHKLTAEEWTSMNRKGSDEEQKKWNKASSDEMRGYFTSSDTLAKKKQFERKAMGRHPVSVVKAENNKECRLLLDAAIEKGNGTVEQREIFERWLGMEDEELALQEEQLLLCEGGRGRLVHAKESGHHVMLMQPDVIVDEVRWILEVFKRFEKHGE